MRISRIEGQENSIVLHLETKRRAVNTYALAAMLTGFADAAKAANASINPGVEVEVVVEAMGPGSFRAKLSAVVRSSKDLLSGQILSALVLSIVANYIYERTLGIDDSVKVEVRTDEVIIQRGDDRIVVPRNVYDCTREAAKSDQFAKAVVRVFEGLEKDSEIEGVAFVEHMRSPPPKVVIPRELVLRGLVRVEDEAPERRVVELVDIQIVKAVLQRGRRKWEFMWRGVKISAPITDDQFYAKFFAHQITIAPGDVLFAKLVMHQVRDLETGIYSNKSYEVVEVIEHKPRLKQMELQ